MGGGTREHQKISSLLVFIAKDSGDYMQACFGSTIASRRPSSGR